LLLPGSVKQNLVEVSIPRGELENLMRRGEQEQRKKEAGRVQDFEAVRWVQAVVDGIEF
jgi:hypothetical protein